MSSFINRAIFVLSLAGLAVSLFLAYEYSKQGPIACPLTGSGCDIVRKSDYSNFSGISLPYLGIIYYLTIAFLTIWLTQNFNKLINAIRLTMAFFGFGFGAYLTFLEAFVIKAYCIWCLTSFIISIGILIFSARVKKEHED